VRHEVALKIGEPVAPPRLRIMLKRPEAAPASLCAIPTKAIAEIGVMTIAWPSARITLGQKSCGAA
jgi:hypothetical protein